MIRVNLLAAGRGRATKKKRFAFETGHKLTLGCSFILVLTLGLIGWRFLAMNRESTQLDSDIAAAQQETARLRSIIQQVQQYEQRRAQLQQRVQLIEQLRRSQTGPVHMLDEISRALPPMLWLTELKQNEKVAGEVLVDGRCTSLTALSDFVKNLEDSGFFKRSIEIVSSSTEQIAQPPGELIKFQIRAQFQPPDARKGADPVKKAG
jgi:type IV pilus assembly protein PilN